MSVWKIDFEDGSDSIDFANLRKVFANYRKAVLRLARKNLTTLNKISSGNLYNSLTIKTNKDGYVISWEADGTDYLNYIDLGVQGAKNNIKAPESPFKFGSGTGPQGALVPAIDKWVVQKPIKEARDSKGRFISRKQLVRSIARSVYLNGLETTYFVSDPLYNLWQRYEKQATDAITEDLTNHLMEKNLELKLEIKL